jgi:hypothetical protein
LRILKTKYDDGTESCSSTGIPKMFPKVAGSIFWKSVKIFKGSILKATPLSKL